MVFQISNYDTTLTNSTYNFCLPMDENIHGFYLQEVTGELDDIEKAVLKLEIENNSHKYLLQVRDKAHSIADLAMVYGFEGIEKISEKLFSTMKLLLSSRIDFNKSILAKINMAVNVMRQVVDLESYIERHMTVERITRKVERKQKKVQSCAEKFSKSFDSLMNKQLEIASNNATAPADEAVNIMEVDEEYSNLWFDIAEQESVLSLTEQNQNSDSKDITIDFNPPDDET